MKIVDYMAKLRNGKKEKTTCMIDVKSSNTLCADCNSWLCNDCIALKHKDAPNHWYCKNQLELLCAKHLYYFTFYCIDCKENICVECKEPHLTHQLMPLFTPQVTCRLN